MKIYAVALALLLCNGAFAQSYRCVKDGKTTYSDLPCDQKSAQKLYEEESKPVAPAKKEPEIVQEYKPYSEAPAVKARPRSIETITVAKQDDSSGSVWNLFVLIIILYFVPTVIAAIRKHHNALAIILLNIFLGWTLLGWVGALVWSVTAVKRVDQDNKISS